MFENGYLPAPYGSGLRNERFQARVLYGYYGPNPLRGWCLSQRHV